MNQNNEMYTINDDGEIVLVSNSYNQSIDEQNLQQHFVPQSFGTNVPQSLTQQKISSQQHGFLNQQNFNQHKSMPQQGLQQKNIQPQLQRQQVSNQRLVNGPKVVSVSPLVQPNRQAPLSPQHSQKLQQNSLPNNRIQLPQNGIQKTNTQNLVQNNQNLSVKNNVNNLNNVNLTRQESLSYDNWKKKNLHMNQMVQSNGQMNVHPQYRHLQMNQNMNNVNQNMYNLPNEDLNNDLMFDLEDNTQNEIQELIVPSLSNRAKHGSFMSNESNKYNKYTTVRAKNVSSALAIIKSKNSESSFL